MIDLKTGDIMVDRVGCKVHILYDKANGDHPIVGLVCFAMGGDRTARYRRDGSSDNSFSIVAKWEELPPMKLKRKLKSKKI